MFNLIGREDGGINSRSQDGKIRESEIYFVGIIDILQQYNNVKRVENFYKVRVIFNFFITQINS